MAYITVLDKASVQIDNLTKESYNKLIKLIESGVPPRAALDMIYLNFSTGYLPEIALILSQAFTAILQKPFTVAETLQYKVGNIALSTKLYVDAKAISVKTEAIIQEHLKGMQDLRQLAMKLYDGYGHNPVEVIQAAKDVLPKYLKEALKQPLETFSQSVETMLARETAMGLKTAPLRAAYLTALDKAEAGVAKKALDKAIWVSQQEKLRYLASRVSQTELARSYAKAQAAKIKQNENQYVQIRASGNHSPDICDMFLKVDRYGLGEGIYPKEDAVVPPYHPHCRCRMISLVNLVTQDTPSVNPEAERKFLAELSDNERNGLLPKGARDYVASGGDLLDYINKRANQDYKLLTIGEL